MRYFEQFPEVTPFGQRGSFHNKVPAAAVAVSPRPCRAVWHTARLLQLMDSLSTLVCWL